MDTLQSADYARPGAVADLTPLKLEDIARAFSLGQWSDFTGAFTTLAWSATTPSALPTLAQAAALTYIATPQLISPGRENHYICVRQAASDDTPAKRIRTLISDDEGRQVRLAT